MMACRIRAAMRGPGQLRDDVAGDAPPREVAAQGEGDADGRVQVRAGDLAHVQDDPQDRQRRGRDGGAVADHAGEGVAHHAPAGRRQDQEEGAEQLGEQAPPLLARVVEVVDAVDEVLLVAGERAERARRRYGSFAVIVASHQDSRRRARLGVQLGRLDLLVCGQRPGWHSPTWALYAAMPSATRVRPADLPKLRRDLGVVQVGMVAAVAADDLERVGVAAFRPAVHHAGRLAPENHRPAMPGLIMGRHADDRTSRGPPRHHPDRVKDRPACSPHRGDAVTVRSCLSEISTREAPSVHDRLPVARLCSPEGEAMTVTTGRAAARSGAQAVPRQAAKPEAQAASAAGGEAPCAGGSPGSGASLVRRQLPGKRRSLVRRQPPGRPRSLRRRQLPGPRRSPVRRQSPGSGRRRRRSVRAGRTGWRGERMQGRRPRLSRRPSSGRAQGRDPVGLLLGQAASRVPELVPVRHGRMLVSPFTYYRGAALPMAADLAEHAHRRAAGAGVRGRSPVELRRVRVARAEPGLRRQRLRRDPAGPVRVGCQAAGRQPDRGRPGQRVHRQGLPQARPGVGRGLPHRDASVRGADLP